MKLSTTLLSMVFCAFICLPETTGATDNAVDLVNDAIDRAKQYQEKIALPEQTNREAQSAAGKAFEQIQSQAFQKKIAAEKNRIENTLFRPFSSQPQAAATDGKICPDGWPATERLILFISSSMPLSVLRTYVKNIDALNDPNVMMVLKGFVGGMQTVRPTLDFLEQLMVRERDCRLSEGKPCDVYDGNIQIDPLLFSRFGIQQVPAVAYVRSVKMIDARQSMALEGNLSQEIDAVVVYGDASLEYSLERIFDETGSPIIKKAVQTLRGDFYAQ
jgi:type-F conjugative transfer system pilin assembly protein TrbC